MITSIHAMFYSEDAPRTRAFLRDVLGWPWVEHVESSPGWLIFRSGPSEIGVHPTVSQWQGTTYSYPIHHSLSFMCDDIEATVDELRAKGATFRGEIEDMGFGRGLMMELPAAGEVLLYQPQHPTAFNLE
ncbi:MAG: VOC family protein [Fimbriimonadaceae bacterium]